MGVWAHLQDWIVQDGEIPELHSGSTLHSHAVRASAWSLRESPEPEGFTELPGPDPTGDNAPHYELTGTVEWGHAPSSVVLRIGGFQVLAEPISIREVPDTRPKNHLLERFSPDFFVPAMGVRATVVCRLELMAEYETEASDYPDLRRDWIGQRLKLQHRALVPVSGEARAWNVDKVLHVDNIERMHPWADEKGDDHVTYLLDL